MQAKAKYDPLIMTRAMLFSLPMNNTCPYIGMDIYKLIKRSVKPLKCAMSDISKKTNYDAIYQIRLLFSVCKETFIAL